MTATYKAWVKNLAKQNVEDESNGSMFGGSSLISSSDLPTFGQKPSSSIIVSKAPNPLNLSNEAFANSGPSAEESVDRITDGLFQYSGPYDLIRGTEEAAGFDLVISEDFLLKDTNPTPEGSHRLRQGVFKTGLKINIPKGYEGNIKPRSSTFKNFNIIITEGTVDSDYLGEIGIGFFYDYWTFRNIPKGSRVAQLVIRPIYTGKMIKVEEGHLTKKSKRGEEGFGSTGAAYIPNAQPIVTSTPTTSCCIQNPFSDTITISSDDEVKEITETKLPFCGYDAVSEESDSDVEVASGVYNGKPFSLKYSKNPILVRPKALRRVKRIIESDDEEIENTILHGRESIEKVLDPYGDLDMIEK